MSRKDRKRSDLTGKGAVELTEGELKDVSAGGDARRFETDFGDPVGNYNFKVEIEGVTDQSTTKPLIKKA
jgi:hypothetical protein